MAIILHYDGSRHDSVTVTLTAMCLSFQFCPTVSGGWLRFSDLLDLGAGSPVVLHSVDNRDQF